MKPLLWPALGATRFFLALIVAVAHTGPHHEFFPSAWVTAFSLLDQHAAVMAFFVISGFSIAASIAKAPQGFYRRRLLRIWPLYVLSILVGCATVYNSGGWRGFHHMPPTWQIVQNLFFLQGWSTVALATNLVVWTLSIEVACYVLAPVFAKVSQPLLLVITLFSGTLYFYYTYFAGDQQIPAFMIHGRSFALMMWFWLAGFILFRAGATIKLSAPKPLCDLCTWLGDVSYPLYLFNWPIYAILSRLHMPVSTGVAVILAIALSAMLDRYFDQPLKRWITRPHTTAVREALAPSAGAPTRQPAS